MTNRANRSLASWITKKATKLCAYVFIRNLLLVRCLFLSKKIEKNSLFIAIED